MPVTPPRAGSAAPKPESSCDMEPGDEPQRGQERAIPAAPSMGDGVWAGAEEKRWGAQKSLGGAAAVPAPQGKAPNTCKDCGQSFSERGLLIVHVLRTHLREQNLPCGECGKIVSGRGRLAAHQRAHLRERTFTCVACTRTVVYNKHMVDQVRLELGGGRPFKCTKCSDRIILMVEPPAKRERGSFPCPHCPKVFSYVYLLQRHQPLHAWEEESCSKCGKTLQRRNALGKPRRRRLGKQPASCAECIRKERRKSPAPEQTFPCAQCGRHFTKRRSLATHLQAHARPLLHPCAQCSQRFSSMRALLAHQRVHTPDRLCRQCGQAFGSREAWAAHRLEHERQKPFTCTECGKGFRRKDRYTMHQWLHAGPGPLACPQCDQHFRLPQQLERHQRLHRAPREARLRTNAQACPAGELSPTAGPATPAACDPGPGASPAWAVVSPPEKTGLWARLRSLSLGIASHQASGAMCGHQTPARARGAEPALGAGVGRRASSSIGGGGLNSPQVLGSCGSRPGCWGPVLLHPQARLPEACATPPNPLRRGQDRGLLPRSLPGSSGSCSPRPRGVCRVCWGRTTPSSRRLRGREEWEAGSQRVSSPFSWLRGLKPRAGLRSCWQSSELPKLGSRAEAGA
ncbi:hypothetical protein KIL84_012004 [Mauremys mutica]|uniref:C2H2-type domain-containing protein n=1 Tax=Mauremys mutica TaxID=74926 RepID=A0A9D4AVW1_9SAUR|nr:hypothetical protein KIL84_012004 [Mauremys mutica]